MADSNGSSNGHITKVGMEFKHHHQSWPSCKTKCDIIYNTIEKAQNVFFQNVSKR